jgi:hypothetical protein
VLALVATVALAATPVEAQAGDDCVAAYEASQVARKAGRLLDARAAAQTCAQSACPSRMAAECSGWAAELDKATPTVILSFQRPDGSDAVGAKVTVDGRAAPLDGLPLPLDPGPHTVRAELDGFAPLEQSLLVQEAQQRRRVGGTFAALAPSAAAPRAKPRVAAIAMASVAGVAVGLGIGFGTAALVEYKQLSGSCAPRCSPSQASDVRVRAAVADVSFAVGAVSLAAALGLFLRKESPAQAAVHTTFEFASLSFGPTARGGLLNVESAF